MINKLMLFQEDERRLIEEKKEEDIDTVIKESLSTVKDICRGIEATVDIVDDALSVVCRQHLLMLVQLSL